MNNEDLKNMFKWLDLYWMVYDGWTEDSKCPVCMERTSEHEFEFDDCEEYAWCKFESFRDKVESEL